MRLAEIIKHLLYITEQAKNSIPPLEKSIYLQVFVNTALMGRATTRLSYGDISALEKVRSPRTIQAAISDLTARGLISEAVTRKGKRASEYRLVELKDSDLDPILINKTREIVSVLSGVPIEEGGEKENIYVGIVQRLSPEDRELLEAIISSLTPAEEERLVSMAKNTLKPGESLNIKLREMAVATKFGPNRLRKYI